MTESPMLIADSMNQSSNGGGWKGSIPLSYRSVSNMQIPTSRQHRQLAHFRMGSKDNSVWPIHEFNNKIQRVATCMIKIIFHRASKNSSTEIILKNVLH